MSGRYRETRTLCAPSGIGADPGWHKLGGLGTLPSSRLLYYLTRMMGSLALLLFGTLTGAQIASAKSRIPAPTEREVAAAMNQKSESDLISYIEGQPPGAAAGHVVRVDAVTGLLCRPLPIKGNVVCRFVAHQGLKHRSVTAALVRTGGVWQIIDK